MQAPSAGSREAAAVAIIYRFDLADCQNRRHCASGAHGLLTGSLYG